VAVLVVAIGLVIGGYTSLLGSRATAEARPTPVAEAPLAEPIELSALVPSAPVAQKGETFFTRDVEIAFGRGRVYISGDPVPASEFSVDDGMRLTVTHPDGSVANWSRDFNAGCIRNTAIEAQDVTSLFQRGVNRVSVTLYDICGSSRGTTTAIWLVNRD
jgi:hypothetical protein